MCLNILYEFVIDDKMISSIDNIHTRKTPYRGAIYSRVNKDYIRNPVQMRDTHVRYIFMLKNIRISHSLLSVTSTEERCLQDFLENLEDMFSRYYMHDVCRRTTLLRYSV